MADQRIERHSPAKRKVPMKERVLARKTKLDKWARARNDAKSNVSEYKT